MKAGPAYVLPLNVPTTLCCILLSLLKLGATLAVVTDTEAKETDLLGVFVVEEGPSVIIAKAPCCCFNAAAMGFGGRPFALLLMLLLRLVLDESSPSECAPLE